MLVIMGMINNVTTEFSASVTAFQSNVQTTREKDTETTTTRQFGKE